MDTAAADEPFVLVTRDCQVLFRYLCQITTRTESETLVESTPLALQGRTLAYELLLSALSQAGKVIRDDKVFLHLIKRDLFLSLSKTGVSTNPALFELTLSVFLVLLNLFHHHVKTEVEVLFNEIYLRLLESPNATFHQKIMVLQSIYKICQCPQYLVDIYVNYDCDLAMESIYERIVNDMCKVSQGRGTLSASSSPTEKKTNEESVVLGGLLGFGNASGEQVASLERKLRMKSLKCLATIMNSLVRWSTDFAPSLNPQRKGSGSGSGSALGSEMTEKALKAAVAKEKEDSKSIEASPDFTTPKEHLSPNDDQDSSKDGSKEGTSYYTVRLY